MAKRLNSSQSNTLFNYFKSPKAEAQKPTKTESNDAMDDSDEDVIVSAKKKRRRIVLDDSDSDSENVEVPSPKRTKSAKDSLKNFGFNKSSPASTPKKPKVVDSDSEDDSVPKKKTGRDSLKDFGFNKGSSGSTPSKSKPVKADDKVNDARWVHEKLEFLMPHKIRDINKRRPSDPDYDERTLHVPLEYLNSLTPGMRQWWELKSRHMDSVIFFKVGKFYELYHMDATVGVNNLGFTYMKSEFAHSGFPETAYGKMASGLIEKGFKVARVEQTETPDMMAERCKQMKKVTKFDKVVKREICQISTQGSLIYTAQLSEAEKPLPCYMVVICEKIKDHTKRFGICFIDTSIGLFHITEFDDDGHCSRLLALLAQHPPALIITEKRCLSSSTTETLKKHLGNLRWDTLIPNTQFYSASTTIEKLSTACYFKNKDDEIVWPEAFDDLLSDGIVKPEYELAIRALGGCIWYLNDSELDIQLLSMGKFEIYSPIDTLEKSKMLKRDYMILDSISMSNLQILGGVGTLQKTLDRCTTPFGKRLLQQWICRPLCDVTRIKERQSAVTELLNNPDLLETTREILRKLPDLERQLSKIHIFGNKSCSTLTADSRAIVYEGKTYAKRKIFDLLSTLDGFKSSMQIPDLFKGCESRLLQKLTQLKPVGMFQDLTETLQFFKEAFDHEKAKSDGTIIPQSGVDRDYDESQENIKRIQRELDDYLDTQKKFFKCDVSYFGNDKKRYQLEIPDSKTNKVTMDYSLESTRKGAKPVKRYSTKETRKFLERMMKAENERDKIIMDLNRKIFEKFSSHYEEWEQTLQCLMILDCLCSFAEYARTYSEDICVPEVLPFSDEPVCIIENGRHPSIVTENFVPNDSELGTDGHGKIVILTGPNMGGKSTLMRQIILISIMAQLGCHVPASSCKVSLIDRIFTRLGAKDDIFKNQSTFLVELSEACSILQHATKHSFILLDELGRGTSTHDGNAIATAYVKKLCEINCRTIFATHYHTLVEYFHDTREIQLGYMMCMVENEGDINNERVTFLYKLAEGLCPKSYGFNVAKLAGLPKSIVTVAHAKATILENISKNRKLWLALLRAGPEQIRSFLS